ncbi:hypothetical protein, partial [Brevibacterium casei]|uniref:hypothetical protein n=1 Tax=Brevibacterium casei TaxID=33889 RepID=UPI003EECBE04
MGINGTSESLVLEGQEVKASPNGDESVVTLTGDELDISENASWRTGIDGGAYAVDSNGDFQLAIAAPQLELADGREIEGAWEVSGQSLEVSGLGNGDQLSEVKAHASVSLIKSVKRSTEKKKPRYIITPTVAGRAAPS